jgi:CspA family cold shock protein
MGVVHGGGRAVRANRLRAEHTESVLSEGTVREWSDDQGWGVIDSAGTPGGCWAHFSVIVAQGYRSLEPGGRVAFTYEAPGQDGFGYRAVQVWPPGMSPEAPQPPARHESPAAYRSSLAIRWQDGSVTKGAPGHGQDI